VGIVAGLVGYDKGNALGKSILVIVGGNLFGKLPSFTEIENFVFHVPEQTRIGTFLGCKYFQINNLGISRLTSIKFPRSGDKSLLKIDL
jgi:hypothetical protein